jgi:hypothetical protein
MKSIMSLIVLVWGVMVLEQSRPDLLPAGTIVLPLVIIGMLWNRTAGGVFVGGAILVVDWIVRPQGLPLLPVILTFGATLILVSQVAADPWTRKRTRRMRLPKMLQPTLLAIVGIALLIGPTLVIQQTTVSAALPVIGKYVMISVPWSLLLTGLMKLAGEFGFRRLT